MEARRLTALIAQLVKLLPVGTDRCLATHWEKGRMNNDVMLNDAGCLQEEALIARGLVDPDCLQDSSLLFLDP